MSPFSKLVVCSILLLAPPLQAQIPETVNPGTVMPDDSVELENRIRKTYDGPLSLAEDHMVWNVTKDKITERVALVNEHTWNPPLVSPAVPPDPNDRVGYSPEIWAERFGDVDEVIKPIYEEAGAALGREFPYPSDD